MAARFVLLLGGARSGKSRLAVELAARAGGAVAVVVTAEALDDEMAARIAAHRRERPPSWSVLEAPLDVVAAVAAITPDTFLIVDCVTLWVSNQLLGGGTDESIVAEARALAVALGERAAGSVVVSNEVGLGVVPPTPLGRRFRDVLGAVNAELARRARRSLLLVAGRAVPLVDPYEALA